MEPDTTELNCALQNAALFNAVENYDICREIICEVVKEVLCGVHQSPGSIDKIGLHKGEWPNQAGKGEKRKLEGQPSLQKRRKRRKEQIEEKKEEEKFRAEKEKMKFWLNGKTENCRYNVENGKMRNETPSKSSQIRKVKFKQKIEPKFPGRKTKRGKGGDKVKNLKEFFEALHKQGTSKSELGVETCSADGGGERFPGLRKGWGVDISLCESGTSKLG